ncbi:unnamed protein product [Nippostrongylus brasiliensis]|uniref:Breast carcinoma-amplified sequence 3 (inferred by orthology to a human protein) n=1 Tax=Nippostrongylus brasiliensis TaxID=27835 RepID=A0A0N4YBE9_NIPBR|nr:unnamed protein product [Nippostrongylus brasiliensis]
MSAEDMPPNMSNIGKKKKREKASQPVQPVHPQPHKSPSPEPSLTTMKDDVKAVLSIEPRAATAAAAATVTKDVEQELLLDRHNCREGKTKGNPATTPRAPPRPSRDRTSSVNYVKGQIARSQPVPTSSFSSTVVEFVHEVTLQHQTQSQMAEKVEWIEIHTVEKAGQPSRRMELVVLGLARGFQVWTLNENGDCEEVLSERQGPIRSFIPISSNFELQNGEVDMFADQRPFVAMVDTYTTVPDRQYCSVSVVSLSNGKGVRRFTFDEPVCGLNNSARYLVVSLSTRLVVHDVVTLTELRSIRVVQPPETCTPAVALNQQLIAFADFKLNPDLQSCGGVCLDSDDMPVTYANQVFNVAKALSRTVTSSVTGGPGTKAGEVPLGIVTIVDLEREINDRGDGSATVAHFAAHSEPLASMAWSPDGRLLLTTDTSACVFNGIAFSSFCRSRWRYRNSGRVATTIEKSKWHYAVASSQLSATNLLALGKDLAPLALAAVGSSGSSKRRASVEPSRVSIMFSSRSIATSRSPSLLIASADGGVVCEYELRSRGQGSANADDPPQIDVCTYSGPHRRLWMGPQFKFYEYREENTSAELMTPSESRHSLSSIKSIPVVIGGAGSSSVSSDATRIECGSWTSELSMALGADVNASSSDITGQIADAMRDLEPDEQQQHQTAEVFFDTSPGIRRKTSKTKTVPDEEELDFDDFR